ncbi:MAG: hypothetical protein KA278_02220 [Flavobacterium sp.]|nr:hypothetical protein [Flavobacterium sp.]
MKFNLQKLILTITLVLSINTYFSQNNIYIGTSKFDANYTWRFKINGGWIQGDGLLTFAKRNGGGMLLLSVKDFNGNIDGNIFIYLKDGSVIKCIDRNINDNVDHYTMAVYYLSLSEVELLKHSDIEDVRFTVEKYPFGPKNYTMSNQFTFYGDRNNVQTNPTAVEVQILMNK